jgi:acetolactate decarboxylase
MPQLNCTLSPGLWQLLQEHSQRTRQPAALIVSKALAEYFDVAHQTLYQVSTATTLVEGIYRGAVRVGTLREHGDLGLGTFEDLDGEMVVLDGHFFQVRGAGSVREVDDGVLSPFAVITRFAPEPAVTLDQCPDMGSVRFELNSRSLRSRKLSLLLAARIARRNSSEALDRQTKKQNEEGLCHKD